MGKVNGGSIRHAVSKAGSAGQTVGTLSGGADVTDVKVALEADMKLAATYMSWQDANGNAVVATEGGKGTPWRIYDGHTTPLLTGLMKGTKRLAKVYDGNVFATTDPHITLVNTGKDVGTYDAYSDQLGYDLIGGATITQRTLTMSGRGIQQQGCRVGKCGQLHVRTARYGRGELSSEHRYAHRHGHDHAQHPHVDRRRTEHCAGRGYALLYGGCGRLRGRRESVRIRCGWH